MTAPHTRRPTGRAATLYALAAGLTLAACYDSGWGERAPFDAVRPPDRLPAPTTAPPAATTTPTDTTDEADPKAPDHGSQGLIDHLYGQDDYPCTGDAACDEPSPADGTLSISIGSVEFIDPNLVTETEGGEVARNIFEGLLAFPRQSGLPYEAGVAHSLTISPDWRVYTFELREDAVWSDGEPVTAHDFVYSWRRKLSPELGSRSVDSLYWLANAEAFNRGTLKDAEQLGVRADGDHRLIVTLKESTPFWLTYATTYNYAPVPRHAIEAHGRHWTKPENIVTNGAYRLKTFSVRDRIVLERSETYWDNANVRIPRVMMRSTDSEALDITRYRGGELQWARMGVPPAEIEKHIAHRAKDFFIDPILCQYHYAFRMDAAPFDDVRVRRAFAVSIDTRRLVQQITRAFEEPADGPVPAFFEKTLGYPKPKGDTFDPALGRKLLAEAGYPGGKGMPKVTLKYNTLERHKLIAEFVARSLKENLGVDIELHNMEFKTLLKDAAAGNFQMLRRGWCGVEHPFSFLEIYQSFTRRNVTGWNNPTFDKLIAESRSAGPEAQLRLLAQAERLVQRDVPSASLFYYTEPYLKKPVLRGLRPQLANAHPYKYMWWGDKQTAPTPHELKITRLEAAAPPQPASAQAEPTPIAHLYGGDGGWPCEGHPTCDEASPADGYVGLGIIGIDAIDPSLVSETDGQLVVENLFEGLINRPQQSGMPWSPGVALRWEVSDDGLVYTFHLRDNAKWSNGRAVTAHDFVYAWRRKLDPKLGSPAAENLYYLANAKAFNQGKVKDPAAVGVKAEGDHKLVVTLEEPSSFWLKLVATGHYAPVPREAIEAFGRKWTEPENIVTNGPFTLEEWRRRERFVLKKSETYWDARSVRVSGANIFIFEDAAMSLRLYKTGAIHWGRNAVEPAHIEDYMKSRRPDFFIDPYLCYYAYMFQTTKPPFDDVRVRRAFNMAIDKRRLVSHVLKGMQVPADGPVLPFFEDTMGYPKPKGDTFDPKQARKLLADAGYPGGKGLPEIVVTYNTHEWHKRIAEFAGRNWKENLGVDVVTENMEWKTLLKKIRGADFQIARYGWCSIEHPYDLMPIFLSYHADNITQWKSEAFDELMAAAKKETSQPRQMSLLAEAEKLVQAGAPMAPLYYYTKSYLKKPVLQGFGPELTNTHLLKYMYWADKE